MANWATTNYVIEGPIDSLIKIEKAIKQHPIQENSSEDWEGNVIIALNGDINWKPDDGHYMRGFIDQTYMCLKENKQQPQFSTLNFSAEEAWGVTDFDEELKALFPDIKVYWETEEPGEGIYSTNDKEGKYFKDIFCVDTCINGNYESDYFDTEEEIYDWISRLTHKEVTGETSLKAFNELHEKKGDDEENYIIIHKFTVIDD